MSHPLKAIIVDDEQHCIDRLTRLLAQNCSNTVHLVAAYNSAADALKGIPDQQPDLVFMDIQLGDMLGIELLHKLPEINFEIIFTTAFDTYAVRAFKFSAIDYLLKPLAPDELIAAISRLRQIHGQKEMAARLDALIQNFKGLNGLPSKINVPTSTGLVFLNVHDIMRCEADVNYTTIHMKDRTSIVVAKTLKEFEGLLKLHNFFRIHNTHLIDLYSIKSYHKGKGGYVVMQDNTQLEVSTRKKELFLKAMSAL